MNSFDFLYTTRIIKKELKFPHTLNEVLVIMTLLHNELAGGIPIAAADAERLLDVSRETAKSITARYSGASYRGRPAYKTQLFKRKQVKGPGRRKLLIATAAGKRLFKLLFKDN